jgi:hypothetical protein
MPYRPFLRVLPVLFSLLVGCAVASAQTSDPPRPKPSSPKRTGAKSPNTIPGDIVSLDTDSAILTLKERSGAIHEFGLTEKTRYIKGRRPVQASDFKTGEAAVAQVRKVRNEEARNVVVLADPATWEWLVTLRRETVNATITEIGENTLTAAIRPDAAPFLYTISAKTKWSKGGKEVTVNDFKAGDTVLIVPRTLPSGGIMARVVSDTPMGAAQMKERQARTVTGVIMTLDAMTRRFTLKTRSGDTRPLRYTETTEVKQGTRTLPLTVLKVGLAVSARLKQDILGDEVAWRITLATGGKPVVPSKSPVIRRDK